MPLKGNGGRRWAVLSALSLLLMALTAASFWPALGNGFVDYDDLDYLAIAEANITSDGAGVLRALILVGAANWHPLTWLSHRLDLEIFGRNPRGHHAVSIGLHAAAAAALFLCLSMMTGACLPSAAAAALFAVHPLRVESVAWVAERKDVLAGFFFMLTLTAYVKFLRKPGLIRYLAAAGACLLALLSKPTAVTLPFLLLLLDWWPLGRWETALPARRLVWEKVPLFAMSAAVSAIAWTAQRRGGTMELMESLSLGDRLANALTSSAAYLGELIVPVRLSVFHPYASPGSPWRPLGAACLLASVSYLAVRWARRRVWLAAGWLWYLGALVPMVGLVQVGFQSMADRYTYLPSIGLGIALCWGAGELAAGLRISKTSTAAVGTVILLLCVALTRSQVRVWRDTETLFGHAVAVEHGNWAAHYYLGKTLADRGRIAEAIEHYRAALSYRPGFAEAWFRLGEAQATSGKPSAAAAAFRRAADLRPGFAEAELGLGLVYDKAGRWDEAVAAYTRAIRVRPGFTEAWFNLGLVQVSRGDQAAALEVLRDLRARDPAAAGQLLPFIRYRFPGAAAP